MPVDQRFRPREHLRRRADFSRVLAQRRRAADSLLVVYVAENELAWSRLGISVAKRVGNAVARNYTRRRIRESFRTGKSELPCGLDIVCVVLRAIRRERSDLIKSLQTLVCQAMRRRDNAPGRPRSAAPGE